MIKEVLKVGSILLTGLFVLWLISWVLSGGTDTPKRNLDGTVILK